MSLEGVCVYLKVIIDILGLNSACYHLPLIVSSGFPSVVPSRCCGSGESVCG